jgi:hypothetical protein
MSELNYSVGRNRLADPPKAYFSNNPALPLPDCVSLRIVSRPTNKSGEYEVAANLRFGIQQLTARLDENSEKKFRFDLTIKSAKLRVLVVEGLSIDDASVKGTEASVGRQKMTTLLEQDTAFATGAAAGINAALDSARTPFEALRVALKMNLTSDLSSKLKTIMEQSSDFQDLDVGFDERGPVWHFLPKVDIAQSFSAGSIARAPFLTEPPVMKFGDGPILKYQETKTRHPARNPDSCLIFAVSARHYDIGVEIVPSPDDPWIEKQIARLGYRTKKEVAQAAIRNIIASRIARESPDSIDGDLLFAVAAAVPPDEE